MLVFFEKKPFVVNNGFNKDKYLKTLSKILKVINIFDMVNVYLCTEELGVQTEYLCYTDSPVTGSEKVMIHSQPPMSSPCTGKIT